MISRRSLLKRALVASGAGMAVPVVAQMKLNPAHTQILLDVLHKRMMADAVGCAKDGATLWRNLEARTWAIEDRDGTMIAAGDTPSPELYWKVMMEANEAKPCT